MQMLKSRSILFTLFVILIVAPLASQEFNPGTDEIFKEDEVTEIRIVMSESDKTFLHHEDNRYASIYVPSDVTFVNSELQNITVPNVGVRLRGNTARNANKRSYKIDFKEYGGERFESYKKINLKPNVNDPSLVRELVTMHLFRQMDVPAPRIAPSVVYINDEFMGVYLMVEQIDDEFVDKRFGKEVGWLYKCGYQATLADFSKVDNPDFYESKMNEDTDTKNELRNFMTVLNSTSDLNFKTEIEKIFEVDRFIRYLAVEAITGHWDGYSYLNNNYYMYYDEDEGKFEFIAYDTDNTLGIDWIDRDWATRDLTHFYRHNNGSNDYPRPLSSRILDVPEYETKYYGYLSRLFKNYFTEEYLYPFFNQLESMLDPHIQSDTYYDDAHWGYSLQDFRDSFDYGSRNHVEYGLRGFVETRRSTGIGSFPEVILSSNDVAPFTAFPNPSPDGKFLLSGKIDSSNIRLYDLNGKRINVSLKQLSPDQMSIVTPNRSGMYLLAINENVIRLFVE